MDFAARHEDVENGALERAEDSALLEFNRRSGFVVDHCAKLRVDVDLAYPLKSSRSGLARACGAALCARIAIDVQTWFIVEAKCSVHDPTVDADERE